MAQDITADIISIGDELLIGQTINTNAGWLGKQLALIGIRTRQVLTISDDRAAIIEALDHSPAQVVLITGGLGPTKDDLTKHTLTAYFGTRLERRPEVLAHIEALFLQFGRKPEDLLEVNRQQADLPVGCTVLPNSRGTASGMWFEQAGRVVISLPGVPFEMQGIMAEHGLERLRRHFHPPTIVHRTILTVGMGESYLAEKIAAWEDGLAADHIKLAYLPSPGIVKLRLSTYANQDGDAAEQRVAAQVERLYALLPGIIYGEGEDSLEAAVGRLLKDRGQTMALAESCTGGHISGLITSIPGSSAYFIGGVVSYANAVKMEELGVPGDMLELNGAVSQPVVERMATGVRQALGSDWAVATSGVAGPDGGTPDKPVGTVWMAVAGPEGVRSRLARFPGTRDLVIDRASIAALDMLRKALLGL